MSQYLAKFSQKRRYGEIFLLFSPKAVRRFLSRLRQFTRKPDRNHLFEYFLEIEVIARRGSRPPGQQGFFLVSSRKIFGISPAAASVVCWSPE